MSPSPPSITTPTAPLRPWPLFLNFSATNLPISFSDSTYRLSQNLRFFLPNYAFLTILVFLFTLLTRPLPLLFFICVFSAWMYLIFWRNEQLTVFDYDVNHKIALGFLFVVTLIGVFWTGVSLRLFVALLIGGSIVAVHGVLRTPEDSIEDSPYWSLLNVVDSPRGDYASV